MKQQHILIIAGAFLALVALFQYCGNQNNKSRYDWTEEEWNKRVYNENYDQPYGSKIFHSLAAGYFDGYQFKDLKRQLTDELPIDSNNQKSTYLFIGGGMFLDSADTQHLMHFVEAGNTALIISKTIPFDLMNFIYYDECDESGWDDYASKTDSFNLLQLLAPENLQPSKAYYAVQNKPSTYTWSYIPSYVFCEELPQQVIGIQNDSLVNFAVFPHGKGRFLLHTTPLAFTNYHLLRPEFQRYAAGVLSHIPQGAIYWDAFSRVPEPVTRRRNARQSMTDLPEEHALTYILKQEPLAWAWYLLIALAILYLVFRTLRKQRPIPVLAQNENSSYEFINTIAHLHFREKNHKGISIQAMKLFLSQVREKYGIMIGLDPVSNLARYEDGLLKKLAARAEVPEESLNQIMNQYSTIARFEPTEQHMIDFYLSLEDFWKKAK